MTIGNNLFLVLKTCVTLRLEGAGKAVLNSTSASSDVSMTFLAMTVITYSVSGIKLLRFARLSDRLV